jgi:hypothetical protein
MFMRIKIAECPAADFDKSLLPNTKDVPSKRQPQKLARFYNTDNCKDINKIQKAGMIKFLIILLCLVCLAPHPLIAGECGEVASSFDANFYTIDSKIILIHSLKCYETFESPHVLAKSNGVTGKIISSYRTGHYRVAITRDKENWYKISDQNMYILTQECLINITEQEALLSLRTNDKGGNGSLHYKREACRIIGLYRPMIL